MRVADEEQVPASYMVGQDMGMAHRDPYDAVVAELTAPPGFVSAPRGVSGSGDRVHRAMVMPYGPFARDPAKIEVLKERANGDRRLYAVHFDDLDGNRWFWLVAAVGGEIGWLAHGVAGGSDGQARGTRRTVRPSADRSTPWLNLCGQWGGDTFYAGGQLHSAGASIGRVRLILADGTQLEDDGIADVSLFIGRKGEAPKTVDVYASDGVLLTSHDAY